MSLAIAPSGITPIASLRGRTLEWAVPAGLFMLAIAIRSAAAGLISFPTNEGSAAYVGVAQNLIEGRGLVSDAIWSYATPPLVLPKPAFELWMPMATFMVAVPMGILGSTFAAAQLGSVLLGAAIAPLTWIVAHEATDRIGLPNGRRTAVTMASGIMAAVIGPFVIAAAVPDSTTPFLILGTASGIVMARHLRRPGWLVGIGFGALLGLAYLSRQEAAYLGIAFALLGLAALRSAPVGGRLARLGRLFIPTAIGGAAVVVPWLLRQLSAFGTLFPGQALENAYLSRNEQIHAYLDRPTLGSFLAQGPATILGHQLDALVHDLVTVLILPAMPAGLIGLVSVVALRRSTALRETTALRCLLAAGVITYLVTSLAFPVATLWGTFLHASGPLVVGLIVVASLGADAAVAAVARRRAWPRANAWLAPLAMLAVALPFTALQVGIVAAQAMNQGARVDAVAAALELQPELITATSTAAGPAQHAVLISDRPIWLAEALGRPVVALPDEPPTDVARLAADFGTSLVVVLDERGRYPAAFLEPAGADCLASSPASVGSVDSPALLFQLRPGCAGL